MTVLSRPLLTLELPWTPVYVPSFLIMLALNSHALHYMLHVKSLWKICLVAILKCKLLTPALCFPVPVDCVTFSELPIQKLSSLLLSLCFLRLDLKQQNLLLLFYQLLLKNFENQKMTFFSLSISFYEDFLFTQEFFKKKISLFSFRIPIPAPTASPPPAPPPSPNPIPPVTIHGIFSHPLSRWPPMYL